MSSIYQLIFFLAIALLAIVITVFVLAVSLLGRAVRLSVEEQEKAEKDLKEDNQKEMEKIQSELDRAKAEGKQPDIEGLQKILRDLKKKGKKHELKLWWIRRKPRFLTASWGALIPGAFFLTSIVISALALYQTGEASTTSIYMWLAVIAMFIGICFICLTLKVIEGVAVISEETAFVREKDRFKTALIEYEKEKKPHLRVTFEDTEFPLHINVNTETTLKLSLDLRKGEFAEDAEVHIGVPEGFNFPKEETYILTADRNYPNYVCMVWEKTKVMQGLIYGKNITIKSPPTPGSYKMICYTFCKGSWTIQPEELQIIVE